MSLMALRFLAFLWPFLKEMILGEKSLLEAAKRQKGRLFVIAVICLSVILNFFTIPRLVQISAEHVKLTRKYNELLTQVANQPPQKPAEPVYRPTQYDTPPKPKEEAAEPSKPAEKPVESVGRGRRQTPPAAQPPNYSDSRHERLQEAYRRLQEQESREINGFQ